LPKAWQKLPHGAVIANSSLLSLYLFTVNVIRQMAPLFSKFDSNKLWLDDQNEQNVICAQFGKDLFNISKVIGRKKVAQFFDSQCSATVLLGKMSKARNGKYCLTLQIVGNVVTCFF